MVLYLGFFLQNYSLYFIHFYKKKKLFTKCVRVSDAAIPLCRIIIDINIIYRLNYLYNALKNLKNAFMIQKLEKYFPNFLSVAGLAKDI